jgi:Holliday junction DNA helicase RuvA
LIYSLKGVLVEKKPDFAALDVNGVVYGLHIPLTTFNSFGPVGQPLQLYTHLVHNEDKMELYGFKDRENLEIFRILISVTGIGPKLALVLLSNLAPADLQKHVAEQNVDRLKRISGIGPKKAEKILFEMKNKLRMPLAAGAPGASGEENDLALALGSLGYSDQEIVRALAQKEVEAGRTLEDKITAALRALNRIR